MQVVWALSVAAGVLGFIAAATYGCQDARTRYYAAQKACIEAGGSWVPTHSSSDNYIAQCLRLAR